MRWRFRRKKHMGTVAVTLLGAALTLGTRAVTPPARPAITPPVLPPPRTPFEAALRDAWRLRMNAHRAVNREIEACEAWDQAAGAGGDEEQWRRQILALDRTGDLQRARAVVQRAAMLARTADERYRVVNLAARLECDVGHHAEELRLTRWLAMRDPNDRQGMLMLRQAMLCLAQEEAGGRADAVRAMPRSSQAAKADGVDP